MKIKKFIPLGLLSLLLVMPMGSQMEKVSADEDYTLVEGSSWQFARIRKHNLTDLGLQGLGTWWNQSSFQDFTSYDSSYFRIPLHASETKDYDISFKFGGGDWNDNNKYHIKVFVNDSTPVEETLPGSWSELKTHTINAHLNEGNNVVVIQVRDWGSIYSYKLPEGLSIIKQSTSEVYRFNEAYNIGPIFTGDILNADANILTGPFKYDGNDDYQAKSTINFVTLDDTKSLNLSYQLVKVPTDNTPGIGLRVNDGGLEPIYFEDKTLNEIHTINISQNTLTSAGFDFTPGAENKLVFQPLNVANDKCVLLDTLANSDVESDVFVSKDLTLAEIRENTKIMGRSLPTEGEIPLDWSASNISFIYHGAHSIQATFKTKDKATFLSEVDGKTRYISVPANTEIKTTISDNLNNGDHLVRIFKSSEANGGIASLTGISIDEEGYITKPLEKDYKFEFYGSSTVCANQVYSDGMEDGYLGFARVVSDAFNAEFNTVCVSGRGLQAGYNKEDNWQASHEKQINQLYKYTSFFRDDETLWDFSSYIPDVLVMNYGNNDLGKAIMKELGFTIDDFTTELKRFHHEIRTIYPNTNIIYIYGMFKNRDYENEYRTAVNELINEGDNKTAFVYTPQMGSGKDSHPNKEEHRFVSMYLSKEISRLLGVEDPLGETIRVEAEDAKIYGRHIVRTPTTDWEQWSNKKYVGNLGPEDPIASASQVTMDGSKVNVIEIPVNVNHSGRYAVTISYASTMDKDTTIYYKANNDEFKSMRLAPSGGWATPCSYSNNMYVLLQQGENKIYVTGTTTNGSWANYDYFQISEVEQGDYVFVNLENSFLYDVSGINAYYTKGSNVNFKINLTENASQFEGTYKVYVNEHEVDADEEGVYTLNNVQEDINIYVRGIVANKWHIYYYDGTKLVHTDEYSVGDEITPYKLGNKFHQRFDGWDKGVPTYMPNNDLTFVASYRYDDSVGNLPIGALIGIIGGSVALVGGGIVLTIILIKKKRAK